MLYLYNIKLLDTFFLFSIIITNQIYSLGKRTIENNKQIVFNE